MTMQQARDFLVESETLAALLVGRSESDWDRPTAFKRWTANDIVVHLHFWNQAADLSQRDGEAFKAFFAGVVAAIPGGGLRRFENERIALRGQALLDGWMALCRDIAARWESLDPSRRVKWAGPDMSVRSSITARQMETWAHGQALFDAFGRVRPEGARLRNIAVLGVNTFGWSFQAHRQPVPPEPPRVELRAPTGESWVFNEASTESVLRGDAVEFCQVVTQTRNVADTALDVQGDAARRWMAHPQCFAGPPETPPAPGERVPALGW